MASSRPATARCWRATPATRSPPAASGCGRCSCSWPPARRRPRPTELLRAAVAVELVHSATLVHDDVLDGSPLRRGRPTVVAAGGRRLATATGDLLFSRAFAELAAAGSLAAVRALSRASSELAPGELMQRADAWRAVAPRALPRALPAEDGGPVPRRLRARRDRGRRPGAAARAPSASGSGSPSSCSMTCSTSRGRRSGPASPAGPTCSTARSPCRCCSRASATRRWPRSTCARSDTPERRGRGLRPDRGHRRARRGRAHARSSSWQSAKAALPDAARAPAQCARAGRRRRRRALLLVPRTRYELGTGTAAARGGARSPRGGSGRPRARPRTGRSPRPCWPGSAAAGRQHVGQPIVELLLELVNLIAARRPPRPSSGSWGTGASAPRCRSAASPHSTGCTRSEPHPGHTCRPGGVSERRVEADDLDRAAAGQDDPANRVAVRGCGS